MTGAPAARRALLGTFAALSLALPVASSVAAAQEPARLAAQERRTPRRVIFTLVGLAVSGAAAGAFALAGDDRNGTGACSDRACVISVTVVGGALIGYMIGREFDELHSLRYRGGAPLTIPSLASAADQSALVVAARDTLVAVAGGNGVRLYASTPEGGLRPLARRGGGVRGIGALDVVPGPGALAVGSPAGFYLFPPTTGPGVLLREGSAQAVTSDANRTYFAVGSRVETAPVGADTTRTWPGIDVGSAVSALAVDVARGIVWAGGDSVLVALRPDGDSLAVVGRLPVDGIVRRLHVEGTRVGVALAERGLAMVDARDAAAPTVAWTWSGTRFVYDVALLPSGRAMVGAGSDGLYLLDAGGTQARVLGLSRDLGFVAAIVARGRYAYVLDRTGDQLRRIDISQF